MLKMVPVTSSNIAALGYDAAENELHIKFKSGHGYIYKGVGQKLYDELMGAESKGGFFHKHILNGDFASRRMGEDGAPGG